MKKSSVYYNQFLQKVKVSSNGLNGPNIVSSDTITSLPSLNPFAESKKCIFCQKEFFNTLKNSYIWNKKKVCSINCQWNYKYHKNKKSILPRQIKYQHKKLSNNNVFRRIYNIRKYAQHNISLKGKVCEFCHTDIDLHRHHPDYSKPLDVIILCRNCHNHIHHHVWGTVTPISGPCSVSYHHLF